jgi:acetolactate synthase I/II/III large subunit
MAGPWSRRDWLQLTTAISSALLSTSRTSADAKKPEPIDFPKRISGARAVVETLQSHGVECVFGIPGAQENELWDEFKTRGLPYLFVTHEFSAACMADGYARSKGKPGVLCIIPGPGITNSMSGLGEALLDSSPIVCIVGDIASGEKYHPFQVHSLDTCTLLKGVTKRIYRADTVEQIPTAIQRAFQASQEGEPGPVAVVIPHQLFIETALLKIPGPLAASFPYDESCFQRIVELLSNPQRKIGIYAGVGCMAAGASLSAVAEMLQAPVSTSVSGKGCISEEHPLAVGWGFGPQGTEVAEEIFTNHVLPNSVEIDTLLVIGAKFSEVSTGFYNNPQIKHVIHVDACASNLGRVLQTELKLQTDAGYFLTRLLGECKRIARQPKPSLVQKIQRLKRQSQSPLPKSSCVRPQELIQAIRKRLPCDGLFFVDVTISCHLAAEQFTVTNPRTYFAPADNQAMGWSIPASIGAQRVNPTSVVATLTGDGCFLMSSNEMSTAAREGLPVKFFILDDQTYQYMQQLQKPAYLRTTATILSRLDYAALAKGYGLEYVNISSPNCLESGVERAFCHPGPVLIRVAIDYSHVKFRWVEAVRKKFTKELSARQKARFLARIGSRAVDFHERND